MSVTVQKMPVKKAPVQRKSFSEYPNLYLEIIENRDKIRDSVVHTDFDPEICPPVSSEFKLPSSTKLQELIKSNMNINHRCLEDLQRFNASNSYDDNNANHSDDEGHYEEATSEYNEDKTFEANNVRVVVCQNRRLAVTLDAREQV